MDNGFTDIDILDTCRFLERIEPGLSKLTIAELVHRTQAPGLFKANIARIAIIAWGFDFDFLPVLDKIACCRGINSGRPGNRWILHYCNLPLCPHCSKPENSNWQRRLSAGETLQPGVVNCIGLRNGEINTAANYRFKAGQSMAIPFEGKPNSNVGALTVNLAVIRVNGKVRPVFNDIRSRFYQAMKPLGHMAYMRLENAMKRAGDLPDYLRETVYLSPWEPDLRDDESLMLTHAHGLIHLDGKSPRSVGNAIRKHYPGNKRVCMRAIKEERLNPRGYYTHHGRYHPAHDL